MKRYTLTISFVVMSILCLLSYFFLDRPIALFFKKALRGELQGFFKTVTHLGDANMYLIPAGILLVLLVGAGLLMGRRPVGALLKQLALAPAFFLGSMLFSGAINSVLKYLVGRSRPILLFDQGIYDFSPLVARWNVNSFPSGHSQAVFAAMTALIFIFPRYDLLWILIAVLVAVSRVVTTVHYFSDVIAGTWLGIWGTILIIRLLRERGISPQVTKILAKFNGTAADPGR